MNLTMKTKHLNPDALRMEESFFAEENAKLLAKLREEARSKERRDALRAALRIENEGVLDALIELDLYPETAVAIGLIPLVEVAWADWQIQSAEREAILKAAHDRGIEAGSTTALLLDNWLTKRPGAEMLQTWKKYITALIADMDAHHRSVFRDGVLAQAREIAAAAGGFLGLGSKISDEEKKVLDDLAAIFD